MKAKLFLLILSLFFTTMHFFGQNINKSAFRNINTSILLPVNTKLSENFRLHNTDVDLKSTVQNSEAIRLKLTCDANLYRDEAIVIFDNTDPGEGSAKFMSIYASAPELWTIKNGQNYSISFMGNLDSSIVVPLTIKAGVPGNYTFTASQLESFGGNSEIALEDRALNSFINLETTPTYAFHISEPATYVNRFYLHFIDSTTVANKELTSVPEKQSTQNFSIYTINGGIGVASLQHQCGNIVIFDMLGHKIATGRVDAGANIQIDMHGSTGVFIVRVLTREGIVNRKILVK